MFCAVVPKFWMITYSGVMVPLNVVIRRSDAGGIVVDVAVGVGVIEGFSVAACLITNGRYRTIHSP